MSLIDLPAVESGDVSYEVREGVAWLRFTRPEAKNALTKEMYASVVAACRRSDEDASVQATVITGSGGSFCAGGDMRQSFERMMSSPEQQDLSILGSHPGALLQEDPVLAIQRSRKLIVAAVNGIAYGAGFILAMASDLTVVSDRARFRIPESLHGVADPWVAARLPFYIGMERAKQVLFTCREFGAEEAVAWGFASVAAPHDGLEAQVDDVLASVLLTAPGARAAYKAAANRLLPDNGPDHPDYQEANAVLRSDEAREGLAAFAEKRKPSWTR